MKAFNYPILKLTIFLAIGIVVSDYISFSLAIILGSIGFILFVLILAHFYCKAQKKTLYWPSFMVLMVMVILGMFVSKIHAPRFSKHHYSHHKNLNEDQLYKLDFVVKKRLKPTAYHHRYYVEITSIDSAMVTGTLVLNLSKDSTLENLKVNTRVLVKTKIQSIHKPLNPYQFDYKNYLERNGIFHQLYLKNDPTLVIQENPKTLIDYTEKIREHLNNQLKQLPFKPIELAFIQALLLGQRQDISSEVYANYAKAGAVHILAISGLHVGIILLILQFLLRPVLYFKQGEFVRLLIILIVLWGFAMISGLSPSVVRAVTMFSLFAIARGIKRSSKPLNTLAVSAFILLLFRPQFCFDVGFQLSYSAVASIVIIKPILDSWWNVKNWFFKKFIDLLNVSIAAQIGVLPLSLFYFHQFPGLFFVTNIVVIPCLIIILGLGIMTLALAVIHHPPAFIIQALGLCIQFMNQFVEWVASKELFVLEKVSFDLKSLILSYIFLFALGNLYHKKTFKNLMILGACILSFQILVKHIPALRSKNSFIVFHKSRSSILGLQSNQHLEIHHNLDSIHNERSVNDYMVGAGIRTESTDTIQRLYTINNKLLLVVDSLGIYTVKSVEPQWVLLRQSPKINLNRLIDSLHPELIIWDGSNYKTDQERWKLSCEAKKIPFHETREKGAFFITY